jgi:hypothetical protein
MPRVLKAFEVTLSKVIKFAFRTYLTLCTLKSTDRKFSILQPNIIDVASTAANQKPASGEQNQNLCHVILAGENLSPIGIFFHFPSSFIIIVGTTTHIPSRPHEDRRYLF